jgi:aspartyl-tRNA(Asn)/glutamyl-tRNA(Gln) amidotransferase subunit A
VPILNIIVIMSLNSLTIKQAHDKLSNKKISATELTRACLNRIEKIDDKINAFITVTEKEALDQAKKIDDRIKDGRELKPLEGIPCSLKDVFCTKGIKSTAASKILGNYIPPFDATATKKLKEQEIVLVGKTNTDEFTQGASTETSYFGVTKNPWNLEKVAGGSSGGSAAAVATGGCIYSLGTDTGGSIRQPASFCGVVGLKPTYGRVSRYGVMSMASSLDTIGPIAKTVEDAAIVLKHIAGKDKNDATTPEVKVDNYPELIKQDIKGLKIGIPKEYFIDGMDDEVKKITEDSIKILEKLGAKITEINLPHTKYAVAVYYIITPSEVSSNMARYDGVRYGHRNEDNKDLIEQYFKTRAEGFGEEVKRRIMIGTYTLSAGYYDAYYNQAQKVRTLIKRDFEQAFAKVDTILTPTSPTPAFGIGENTQDPLKMYLADIFTVSANLSGVPALSVPAGFTKDNLPVGVQFLGKHFDEKTILRVGHNFEQATDLTSKKPLL